MAKENYIFGEEYNQEKWELYDVQEEVSTTYSDHFSSWKMSTVILFTPWFPR